MKKYLIVFFIITSSTAEAQITYQHTFPGPSSAAASWTTIINLGDDSYKYFFVDYVANQFSLYNLDFTPFLTINLPVQLGCSSCNFIGYVTKSLFDCDTNMIEYAVMPGGGSFTTFYVFRQDGTLLFQRDSVIAPWCYGCNNGSTVITPVQNSPSGTVLYLCPTDSIGHSNFTEVYSLCGQLPTTLQQNNANPIFSSFAFPNPAAGTISFKFNLPDNLRKYHLSIYDQLFHKIGDYQISGSLQKMDIDINQFSNGNYFYKISNELNYTSTGKFIINN